MGITYALNLSVSRLGQQKRGKNKNKDIPRRPSALRR